MKGIWIAATVALSSLVLCMLAGCAQPATQLVSSAGLDTSSSGAVLGSLTSDPMVPVVGAGDVTVRVRNETGYDVIGVRIKDSGATQYTAANSFDGFDFASGTDAGLSFTSVPAASRYDVLLLTSEDSKIAVRDIDLENNKNIVFHFEEGIGFITYTDAETGEAVDNRAEAIDAEDAADAVSSDLETQQG